MRKRVVFIANSLDSAYKFQQILLSLDAEVSAGSTLQIKRLLASDDNPDLVIFEAHDFAQSYLAEVESFVENNGCSLLVIVDKENAAKLSLPTGIHCDFVMQEASRAECAVRVRYLLEGKDAIRSSNSFSIDDLVINFATYQVSVAGEPVDFTYLEYALLAYLVQHPDRTFSRESLLESVWGFDYCGGARTVDVHVRRIRAKLGPNLAQYIETVRGVGYYWKSR